MRTILFTLILATPIASFAQTPHDLQNLVQPQAIAFSASHAPSNGIDFVSGFTARDVAAAIRSSTTPASVSRPANTETFTGTGMTAANLASLAATPSHDHESHGLVETVLAALSDN